MEAARPFIKERWLPVAGFDGYEVSDFGRVRSWRRSGRASSMRKTPLVRKQVPDKDGYLTLILSIRGEVSCKKVHHLVLEAFVGQRGAGQECLHGDRNPRNNRLTNLSWGTSAQNTQDQIRHGTDTRGHRNGGAKLTPAQVRALRRRLIEGEDGRVVATKFGVSEATVSRIKHGVRYAIVA